MRRPAIKTSTKAPRPGTIVAPLPVAPSIEPAAEWVATETLRPWAKNPRYNADVVAKIAASVERFGFGAPIVARRENGEIIAGHTRLLAALKLGLDRVPVRYLDLSESEAHLLALADNKLGELADWDEGALIEALSPYGLEDAALAGWDSAELDKLAKSLDSGEPESDPEDDKNSKVCPNCGHDLN